MNIYQLIIFIVTFSIGCIWFVIRMDRRFNTIDKHFDGISFGSINKDLTEIKTRLTRIETILDMMGAPIRALKTKK